MSDDNQIEIPQSFIALFVKPGRSTPSASHEVVLARYEQCEDLASVLIEHAQMLVFKEGLEEADVLRRCLAGLLEPASGLPGPEARWVIFRLAELLGWDEPTWAAAPDTS